MQLPAELAHVAHPQRPHLVPGDADLARAEPRKLGVAQIGSVSEPEQLPRARTREHEHAALLGHVGDLHALAGPHALDEPIPVAQLRRGGG